MTSANIHRRFTDYNGLFLTTKKSKNSRVLWTEMRNIIEKFKVVLLNIILKFSVVEPDYLILDLDI